MTNNKWYIVESTSKNCEVVNLACAAVQFDWYVSIVPELRFLLFNPSLLLVLA
jgi:hypothetical protein